MFWICEHWIEEGQFALSVYTDTRLAGSSLLLREPCGYHPNGPQRNPIFNSIGCQWRRITTVALPRMQHILQSLHILLMSMAKSPNLLSANKGEISFVKRTRMTYQGSGCDILGLFWGIQVSTFLQIWKATLSHNIQMGKAKNTGIQLLKLNYCNSNQPMHSILLKSQ